MKKILFLAFFTFFMNFQNVIASEYSDQEFLSLIDLDPCQYESATPYFHLNILAKELEATMTYWPDDPNPIKSFEEMIQQQNQNYISSFGPFD